MVKYKKLSDDDLSIDLNIYNSFDNNSVNQSLNREWLRDLQGANAYKVYQEMLQTNITVATARLVYQSLGNSTNCVVRPASDDPEALNWAEFIEQDLKNLDPNGRIRSFKKCVEEWIDHIFYGMHLSEITYHKDEKGYYHISSFIPIDPAGLTEWEYDPQGLYYVSVVQKGADGNNKIPLNKCLYLVYNSLYRAPNGISILKPLFLTWKMLRRIVEYEAAGIGRDLGGIPVFRVPAAILSSTASSAARSTLEQIKIIGEQIRANERAYVLFPGRKNSDGNDSGYDLELLSSAGAKQHNLNAVFSRYDSLLAQGLMIGFIKFGHQTATGSYSLAATNTDLLGFFMANLLDNIYDALQHQVVNRLMMHNKVPKEYWPLITHTDIEQSQLGSLGDFLQKMVASGIISADDNLEKHVREFANLPLTILNARDKTNGKYEQGVNEEDGRTEPKDVELFPGMQPASSIEE